MTVEINLRRSRGWPGTSPTQRCLWGEPRTVISSALRRYASGGTRSTARSRFMRWKRLLLVGRGLMTKCTSQNFWSGRAREAQPVRRVFAAPVPVPGLADLATLARGRPSAGSAVKRARAWWNKLSDRAASVRASPRPVVCTSARIAGTAIPQAQPPAMLGIAPQRAERARRHMLAVMALIRVVGFLDQGVQGCTGQGSLVPASLRVRDRSTASSTTAA
jgi:hypothetical protein